VLLVCSVVPIIQKFAKRVTIYYWVLFVGQLKDCPIDGIEGVLGPVHFVFDILDEYAMISCISNGRIYIGVDGLVIIGQDSSVVWEGRRDSWVVSLLDVRVELGFGIFMQAIVYLL